MNQKIPIDESKNLHLEQWVEIYGIFSNCCHYINTCQVYQLEAVLIRIPPAWWDKFLLKPVDEES